MTIKYFYNTIALACGQKIKKEVDSLTEEKDINTVVLQDDEGKEHEFEVMDVYEIEGKEYAVLVPVEESEEDSAFIFRIEQEDGEDVLVDIEDDEEWSKVVSYIEEQEDLDEE